MNANRLLVGVLALVWVVNRPDQAFLVIALLVALAVIEAVARHHQASAERQRQAANFEAAFEQNSAVRDAVRKHYERERTSG
jgi:hypothetical protein